MAYTLDTNSFLNAFYCFTSRRGLPQKMNSDNGTNFVDVHNELQELVNETDKNQTVKKNADKGIKWEFNPPGFVHILEVFMKP